MLSPAVRPSCAVQAKSACEAPARSSHFPACHLSATRYLLSIAITVSVQEPRSCNRPAPRSSRLFPGHAGTHGLPRRREIMLGEIEPGAMLPEMEVAARFRCSQSPVATRSCCCRKRASCSGPHRGTRVSDLHQDEAIEMLPPAARHGMPRRAAHLRRSPPAERHVRARPAREAGEHGSRGRGR